MTGPDADILPGNCLPIANIPVGEMIHCIELYPGKGAQLVRAAGDAAQLMAKMCIRDRMKSVPLPRIGMRVVKTAVAVMLSYTIFVPFGLIYNEALGGVWGQLGPLYACIACIICTQSTLGQTIQQGLSRLIGVAVGGALGTATLLPVSYTHLPCAVCVPWTRTPPAGASRSRPPGRPRG